MSFSATPPSWRLPEGVNGSLWEYTHSPRLAEEEDAYFQGHPLFQTDARVVDERFTEPGLMADLGCGTGRHALRFARRGFRVVAVELSRPMLERVHASADGGSLPVLGVEANLCRLGCFPNRTFDYALSMFSTIGMIHGKASRSQAMAEIGRILKPGGRLALHVHNLWLNLHDSQGRLWLAKQLVKHAQGAPDAGDRKMTYRGIPAMEVHLYRWGELKRDLRNAGLVIDDVLPIDAIQAQPIRLPWLAHSLRAGGWIVFASRPDR
ncbi:class I SAM-dependent methyltransferase [Singulisphaera sp. PoT]|uniref:class I SAM-dependent methyltransferase n=1 Tax=Singulisphaera sp. PoT TaxID=3411797 RepID=UPI003BF5A10A